MNRRALIVVLVVGALLVGGAASMNPDAETASDGQTPLSSNAELIQSNSANFQQLQTSPPAVSGSPNLEVHLPDPKVNPGQTNEVTIQVSNDGELRYGSSEAREISTTARNVRIDADAEGTPLTVESGQTAIGSVTENQPGQTEIAVSVPDDVEAGTYEIDVEVRYSYTRQQDGGITQDRTRTITESVELEVDPDARFEITNATTDAQVGDQGTLAVDVENIGADTAHDADVVLESTSGGLTFGTQPQDAARITELEPGETTTVSYDVAFGADAPVREYTLDGTVTFRTSDGLQRVDERPSVGVTPQDKQRFSIDDVESELYVGEDGDVRGTITNDGPVEAQNVVIRYTDESPNVIPIETSVTVGTLAPGESASFRLPVEMSGEAEAVDRTVDVAVQYRNADFEMRQYEDVELLVAVEPKRSQFLLDVQDREIEAGETIQLDVEVTNNLDEPVTDVEARLFANSPLDSDDDEAFTETLEPGESTTLTFELSAESAATPKTHPISFDFRYDDARGNSQLSDTTRVPITVVEAEGGIPWLPVVVGLLVLGVGGWYYLHRRES